jgi:guanylate kinase
MSQPATTSTAAAPAAGTVTVKRLVDVLLFVGPSGCGKSTIITQLQQEWPQLFEFSVSHTTRAPRQGEVDGKHYHFVSFDEFQALISAGAMVEYSRLSSSSSTSPGETGSKPVGNMYGTSKEALHKVLDDNRVVLMDTDLLGAINIRRYCAHVVVDSRPVTVTRCPKADSTTADPAAAKKSDNGRYVEVLPESTENSQPAVNWQVPRLDVSSGHLKCHSQLPTVPPVSSMPHASRLVRCMVIFIAPPSMQELEERLRERKSETVESLRMRMDLNKRWMKWAQENKNFFDHYIVNDNLQTCYARVRRIVRREVLAVSSSL